MYTCVTIREISQPWYCIYSIQFMSINEGEVVMASKVKYDRRIKKFKTYNFNKTQKKSNWKTLINPVFG